jgi:urea transport system permease protein
MSPHRGYRARHRSPGPIPPTEQEVRDAIGTQIFGVVGGSEIPWSGPFRQPDPAWRFGGAVPGLLALVFGWLAFRSRVTGVYLSILTQAMTLALSLYLFQNDSGLRGNNGLSGLQNIPGPDRRAAIGDLGLVLLGLGLALGLGYLVAAWVVSGKFGNRDPRHPRRRGARALPRLSRWRPTSWWSSP